MNHWDAGEAEKLRLVIPLACQPALSTAALSSTLPPWGTLSCSSHGEATEDGSHSHCLRHRVDVDFTAVAFQAWMLGTWQNTGALANGLSVF